MASSSYSFFSSRRRHTRFKCDWSSDVCSSDLAVLEQARDEHLPPLARGHGLFRLRVHCLDDVLVRAPVQPGFLFALRSRHTYLCAAVALQDRRAEELLEACSLSLPDALCAEHHALQPER